MRPHKCVNCGGEMISYLDGKCVTYAKRSGIAEYRRRRGRNARQVRATNAAWPKYLMGCHPMLISWGDTRILAYMVHDEYARLAAGEKLVLGNRMKGSQNVNQ